MIMKQPKSFIFLGDVFKIKNASTILLFDDYKLKRPNRTQLSYIKKFIDDYTKVVFFKINRFETRHTANKEGGYNFDRVDKKDWNYWVIEHSKGQMERNFPLVLGLSRLDLTVLFEGVYFGAKTMEKQSHLPGIMGRQLSVINFFHDTRIFPIIEKEITEQDKQELKNINSSLTTFESIKKNYDFIDKALEDFLKLKDVSEQSPFKILGYFSILELLLTTYREKGTNDTSLNSQLQKKINLLNNQLENKIDFTIYFKGPNTITIEKIIEKLYRYRNNIAHGNKSDFEDDLQILKGKKENIIDFLHLVVKRLLLKAIKEPQLIKDLKEC